MYVQDLKLWAEVKYLLLLFYILHIVYFDCIQIISMSCGLHIY